MNRDTKPTPEQIRLVKMHTAFLAALVDRADADAVAAKIKKSLARQSKAKRGGAK